MSHFTQAPATPPAEKRRDVSGNVLHIHGSPRLFRPFIITGYLSLGVFSFAPEMAAGAF